MTLEEPIMKRIHTLIPLILAGLLTLLGACGGAPEKKPEAAAGAPVTVQTATATQAEWPARYEAVGTVRARTAAVIAAKVMGYVKEIKVDTGDRVQAGQVLLVLDARDLDAGHQAAQAVLNEARAAAGEVDGAIAAAQAQLDLAQVTYQRMKDLYDKKSISPQEFDEASARLKMAQTGYEMAQAKKTQVNAKIRQAEEGLSSASVTLGYATITAPFDGVVTEKPVQLGNLTAPGMPLLTVERAGAHRLEVAVEESRLSALHVGDPVAVSLDALHKQLDARITEIVPAVDAASRSFIVKIDLPAEPALRSGLFGRAVFSLGQRPVLTIPATAVVERGQLQSVFVVETGRARNRLVTLGETFGDRREVLSGLAAGETLVAPVTTDVVDGIQVEVRQ
jgi:multidrug efflux system membrane fusion protein